VKVNNSNESANEEAKSASVIKGLSLSVDESFVVCLSSNEKNFLERLTEGHSYHQIAEGMNVSVNTVRDHVRSVYKKLRVNSRTQAVAKYLRAHIESAAVQPGTRAATTAETAKNIVQVAQVVPPALNLKSRIFLVDDHAMFREGMRMLIDHEPDLKVCGEATEAGEALRSMEKMKPDLAIADLSLSGITGMELVKSLKAKHRDLAVQVVSMHEESVYAERVLQAGADGYVMKDERAKTVKEAIRKVLGGGIYLSEKMTTSLLDKYMHGRQPEPPSSPMEKLSDRELQVFQMLGEGKMTRHIAQELGLRTVTINTFRHRMMKKLNLKNSFELVLLANKWVREGNFIKTDGLRLKQAASPFKN
jgi:DNA-binding NarL/FixJ family response regulator